MAEPGVLRTPVLIRREFVDELPCPTCGGAVASFRVLGYVVGQPAARQEQPSHVEVSLSLEAAEFAMEPCGCRFDGAGEPVPAEVPC